jgi:hypothetical protein
MIGAQFRDTGYASQHGLHWCWLANELIQNASRYLYLSAHMVGSFLQVWLSTSIFFFVLVGLNVRPIMLMLSKTASYIFGVKV